MIVEITIKDGELKGSYFAKVRNRQRVTANVARCILLNIKAERVDRVSFADMKSILEAEVRKVKPFEEKYITTEMLSFDMTFSYSYEGGIRKFTGLRKGWK